ncbi:MAG: hypothetical protein HYV27_23530 [Candidatus Hydrogenedentes bacterium]|nr:hypothetical protein [Candidatus Hydrogenedentota bacterium]
MGRILIDQSQFMRVHHHEPDQINPALWTFHIQTQDICFWGRYPEAAGTAKVYAASHGLDEGTIQLVEWSGVHRACNHH